MYADIARILDTKQDGFTDGDTSSTLGYPVSGNIQKGITG